ncbi:chromatin remodeling complex subunit [Apiospora hydei]|uniref:Chromatin remodeling complex subunit n=1 Tax=Apiospora hydei TaxID=1337664 RepID=A0ABR1W930_9PEZI
MSGQQGKWKEEQVLVICPGSQTTLAQLGCNELTLPSHRLPTRMFKDPDTDDYLPYHTYKRKKATAAANGGGDAAKPEDDDEFEYVEDRDSSEGAIYPIQRGRIANMSAFLAFLDHVHQLLTTSYHNTPIVLMASPQWTRGDNEIIARFIFEKTKTPALCLMHSAYAAQYGLKWLNMTVVDIGYEKMDVSCIWDSNLVAHKSLDYFTPGLEAGSNVLTKKLHGLLKEKGFTLDIPPLAEVLPYVATAKNCMELPDEDVAAEASAQFAVEAPRINEPTIAASSTAVDAENGIDDKAADEGVLDVANIVTSGNTREFLAKKEKEKAERAKAKHRKAQEAEAAANRPARLPNAKRKTNLFHYEETVHEDVQVPLSNGAPKPESAAPPATNGDGAAAAEPTPKVEGDAAAAPAPPAPTAETATDVLPFAPEATSSVTERRTKRIRKDIEVGLERFLFVEREYIDQVARLIYNTIQSIPELSKRPECWNNIVFVGNGSRLRGLKENVLQTLISHYLISPSTATMFTSELPSNMATPTGTGSQTPTGSTSGSLPLGQMPLPTTSSVNPLLQAATTASLGVPGTATADAHASHQSHAQTPTSIKLAQLPNYLQDWSKAGYEEAHFLGALVAGRLVYCVHPGNDMQDAQRLSSLSRVDYNEHGPKAIRKHCLMP